MLSVVIHSKLSYSAVPLDMTADTPEVCPSRSSRTRDRSSQISTRLQQIGASPAPGCDEPTSRCQTASSMWTLGRDQPVIPRVTFIRWATPIPLLGAGSLSPTFVSDRLVGLSVRPTYFRRQPPQLNYPPSTVPELIGLELHFKKGGISKVTPYWLASILQSLPPILHILKYNPIPSCSKAP